MRFKIGDCVMADKVPQFEHYARETQRTLGDFMRNPRDKNMQLELFRVLQVTGLLYRHIGRRFGSSYGNTANKLRETAKEAIRYLPSKKVSSPLLGNIKYYLNLLVKQPSNSKSKRAFSSRLEKIAV